MEPICYISGEFIHRIFAWNTTFFHRKSCISTKSFVPLSGQLYVYHCFNGYLMYYGLSVAKNGVSLGTRLPCWVLASPWT